MTDTRHTTASDPDVAGMLTDMMGGSPVLVVPALGEITLKETDVVVNMPFLTWPQGGR